MIFIVIKLATLVFSIVIHEVAHGYAAHRLGDPTARMSNRLTLNPLAHVDPVGSVILPLILVFVGSPVLFGWAKPVPFNPQYFRDPRRGIMIVGAAGPLSNFALAVACGILFRFVGAYWGILAIFLAYMCVTNVMLGVFNLIPIPPLDGSRVLFGILPQRLLWRYMELERYGFIIVFILLWAGVLDRVMYPIANFLLGLFLGPTL